MTSQAYAQAVLLGLRRCGMSSAKIARVSGLSAKRIEAVLEGKSSLSNAHLEKIEIAAGKTGGQLAIIGAGIKDRALSDLMDGWAKTADTLRRKPKRLRAAVG